MNRLDSCTEPRMTKKSVGLMPSYFAVVYTTLPLSLIPWPLSVLHWK